MTPFLIAWVVAITFGSASGLLLGWLPNRDFRMSAAKSQRIKALTGNASLASLGGLNSHYERWMRGSLMLEPNSSNFESLRHIVETHEKDSHRELQYLGRSGLQAFQQEDLYGSLRELIAKEEESVTSGVASPEVQSHVRDSLIRIRKAVAVYVTNWVLANAGGYFSETYGRPLQEAVLFARACNNAWVSKPSAPAVAEPAYRQLVEGAHE